MHLEIRLEYPKVQVDRLAFPALICSPLTLHPDVLTPLIFINASRLGESGSDVEVKKLATEAHQKSSKSLCLNRIKLCSVFEFVRVQVTWSACCISNKTD